MKGRELERLSAVGDPREVRGAAALEIPRRAHVGPAASPPISAAMIAFCTWSRFSASSQTRLCGPSITSAATSSPRCAGRQCRKIAFLSAAFMSCRAHREPGERALALFLLLLLAHRRPDVGVDDVRARAASIGSRSNADLRRLLRASEQMIGRLVAFGTREVEVEAESVRRVDPRVRHVVAVADPRVLLVSIVAEFCADGEQSASTWQGCRRSVSPLMTGTRRTSRAPRRPGARTCES